MASSKAEREKRKETLAKRLNEHPDFLIGSVVEYRLKCGKNCRCNDGTGHPKFFLSFKKDGKTRNLYLPKETVAAAREMTRSYARLKKLLKAMSQVNYQLLRLSRDPGGRRRRKTS